MGYAYDLNSIFDTVTTDNNKLKSKPDYISSSDFNMVSTDTNGSFVRVSEINEMIKYGAITIDKQKMKEYKFDTTIMYDKDKFSREEAMKLWGLN